MEYLLNKTDLEILQDAFMADGLGYNNRLSLTKSKFCEAILCILSKGTTKEWEELFDKIDVMRTGTVDWDKFANHMMSVLMERDDRVRSTQVPQWKKPKTLINSHKDSIQNVLYMKSSAKYLVISKEGCVTLWNTKLHLSRTLRANTDSCKMKDVWVTSCVALYNLNKLAVTFTSKEIAVYDLSTKQSDFPCQYRIRGLHHAPISIDYWSNPDNSNDAVLIWGDVGGFITYIQFTSASISLFERPTQPANEKQEITFIVDLSEVGKKYKNARLIKYRAHSDWVRQVYYNSNLSCIISCSTTSADSLVISWIEKDTIKPSSVEMSQGINAFDYHSRSNLLATAGVNNHVCLWNPYVVSKPTGVLRGHMTSVVQVCFLQSRNQLASFSKDKVLRIWDIQLQICVQRLAGVFSKGPEASTLLYYDDQTSRLFITFNCNLMVLEIKTESHTRIKSHDKPVQAALYNPSLSQMISGGQEGIVIIWMLDSGQKVRQFSAVSSDETELTSLAHDHSMTRILTASSDGYIKIWDYNGYCSHTLCCNTNKQQADICHILSLKRSILAAGWTKRLMVFYESALKNSTVEPAEWKGGQEHSDDILALAFHGTDTLATGSFDGEIIIWNNSSQLLSKRLKSRMRSDLKKSASTVTAASSTARKSILPSARAAADSAGKESKSTGIESFRVRPGSNKISLSRLGAYEDCNDFGYAVTRLLFLPASAIRQSPGESPPNLVSCGGGAWVRFWSTTTCELRAEFVAHANAGSIIMTLDDSGQWLATADVDGLIKVWNMSDYYPSLNTRLLQTNPPALKSQFRPHDDMISSLEFCIREERILILSASYDCSVALSDISGALIGVFGQEMHWKIEPKYVEAIDDNGFENVEQRDEAVVSRLSTKSHNSRNWTPDYRATSDPENYRVNAWKVTCLGKDYQEKRESKRERKQIQDIQSGLLYQSCEKTNRPPLGPHSALQTSDLAELETLRKPDFINNPDKYFTRRYTSESKEQVSANNFEDLSILRAPFDERSLFPRHMISSESNSRYQNFLYKK